VSSVRSVVPSLVQGPLLGEIIPAVRERSQTHAVILGADQAGNAATRFLRLHRL
jgi:hypothetical protein